MIARAASEMWNDYQKSNTNSNNNTNNTTPIFIDRNGERFAYVLDYMRDNKINLPITIPKAAMVDDLNYYGFDNIDSIPITIYTPLHAFLKQTKSIEDTFNTQIREMEQVVRNQLAAVEEQVNDTRIKIDCMTFARDCLQKVMKNQSLNVIISLPDYADVVDDKEQIEKYLNMCGLSWSGKRVGNLYELDFFVEN